MKFTDTFIRRPVLSASISLLILLLGLQALFSMQVRQYPELSNTVITVTTPYHGASSELIQGFVTQPLQQAVAEVEGVDYVQSQSRQGQSQITIQMRLNSDPDAALAAVLAKVNSVRGLLPAEVEDPVIGRSSGGTTSILYIAFSSDTLDASQITDFLHRVIQPQLVTIPGVAKANLIGGTPFAVRIWLDPHRMAALRLSAEDVLAALRANNFQAAPGRITSDYFQFNVDADTGLTRPEQFEDLVVASPVNALVRLRDFAEVTMEAGRIGITATADGAEAVLIGLDPTPTANPLTIAADVRARLPDLERLLPETIRMKLLYDSTVAIKASIGEVVKTIAEAVAIVVVVIFLFMGSLRAVLIPVVTIPLSLIGVAMVMQAMGFSINLMTLLAMVLAIGLVVDDAIVVVENVDRHLAAGEPPFRAAIIGTREIALPVITMTITLAAVYAPIALLGGLTGTLFKEFALTLAGAVFVSGVVALTLSPMMSAQLLHGHGGESRFAVAVHRTLDRIDARYSGMLDTVLAHRPVMVVFALIVLASLPFLFAIIPTELAPQEDNGVVMVMATAPEDANVDYLRAHMARADRETQKLPAVASALTIAGVPEANQGLVVAPLVPWSERTLSQQDAVNALTPPMQEIPGISATPFSLPPLPGASSGLPVQFVIRSPGDYQTLFNVASEIERHMKQSGRFVFSRLDLNFNAAQVNVHINRDKAGAYAVTMQSIGNLLGLLMGEGQVSRVNIEGRSYEVIAQVAREDRLTPEAIGDYYVISQRGDPIPLRNLVDITVAGKPRSLAQFNQVNSATIGAVIMPGRSLGDAVDYLESLADEQLPPDFTYDFLGEARQYVSEGAALYFTFGLAILIIFLVLAAQFESPQDPLVILISVPMAICGALLVMAVGLAKINIYTQIGVITLVGLISKHGILICEVAKAQQLEAGADRFMAVREAARIRLRPILMTTAAMVAGLVPLLFASGAGAAARFDLGLVIVAGLTIGTLFTLFVLPVVYTFIADEHKPLPRFETA